MGLWRQEHRLLVAQLRETLTDNDYEQQGCGEVIAKSKQSGTSPERSSYSIVVLVSVWASQLPIQLSEKRCSPWEAIFLEDLRGKSGLWWSGGFIGDFSVFGVFRDGKLW
jgi:hypothetical protein